MKLILTVPVLTFLLATAAPDAQSVSAPKSVQLTVYNADFALVKDTRTVTLNNGANAIEVPDVAARIDPTSILFKCLTAPNAVSILEQNYQYDLINPDNILNKSVGQRVTFISYDQNGNRYTRGGILLNPASVRAQGSQGQTSTGGLVIRADDGSVILRPQGEISLERMPQGLHPRPTLNWLLESGIAGDQQAEISYLTDGIGWKADYVALVDKEDKALDLAGWVTLDNRSGATYEDARLTLMAGDVRKLGDPRYRDMMMRSAAPAMEIAAGSQFEEKSFFEYHTYTMQRPTTIRDNETKQLSLLNASDVPTRKELIYDGRQSWWRSWWYPGRVDYDPGRGSDTSNYHKVNIVLEVVNSKQNHMGMPLPKGKVRVYKLDDDGSQQFIGEDMIDHTAKDEKLRLYLGDAFDVVGDHKRTEFKKIASNVQEESFQVNLRNHKDAAVEVKVVEHAWSDWTVTASSHKHTKKDAHTIEFPVNVPANGETVVTYTIRTTW